MSCSTVSYSRHSVTAVLYLLLIQFDKSTTIYDACQRVRYKVPEAAELKQRKYKLFDSHVDKGLFFCLLPFVEIKVC